MISQRPQRSIIVPAYQEAARIESTLDQLAGYLKQHNQVQTEVVVVVADSPDGTATLARAKASLFASLRVVEPGTKVGKGRDVRVGIYEAVGEHKLFMDADLATPLHHLEPAWRALEQGADVVIAVRNLTSSHTGLRRLVSGLGNALVRLFLLPGYKDTQCGFKGFTAAAGEQLFSRQTILGWGFDMEILTIARQLKLKVVQLPISDWSDKPNGTFEDQVSSAAIETLGEMFTIWWQRLRGRYRQPSFTYKAGAR
ncbi:glycosyltransferase [Patescibacteria group bacterium]|nr:MAG: glycosyltransferase [Patescibacteria group bacterium]